MQKERTMLCQNKGQLHSDLGKYDIKVQTQ